MQVNKLANAIKDIIEGLIHQEQGRSSTATRNFKKNLKRFFCLLAKASN